MKKILIALPLVLIMLLTMIPVAADEAKAEVKVTINYFAKADDKQANASATLPTMVDEKVAKDEKQLKAAVEEFLKGVKHPDGKEYKTEVVKVTKMSQAEAVKKLASITEETYTLEQYKALVQNLGFTFDESALKPAETPNISQSFLTTMNTNVGNAIKGKVPPADMKIVLKSGDLVKADAPEAKLTAPINYMKEEAGAVTKATAEVKAVLATAEAAKPAEGGKCVKPCEYITIKAFDLSTNAFHPTLQFKYKTVENQIPEFSAAIEHMMSQIADADMQVVNNFDLTKQILLPATNDKCEIIINVIPVAIRIDVIHELFGCCTDSKGVVTRPRFPEKAFKEENVWVPFIEFTTQRVINQVKAEEWATTRIQQVTGAEWVFEKATFMDKFNPGRYLTGKVYTIDGKEIGDIANWYEHRRKIDVPTVIIQYRPVNCIAKDEEKVDNATVENNNNTTAPVTANGGANLPATGAKDVSAFFLSAVALLGLGIFFAKKH